MRTWILFIVGFRVFYALFILHGVYMWFSMIDKMSSFFYNISRSIFRFISCKKQEPDYTVSFDSLLYTADDDGAEPNYNAFI